MRPRRRELIRSQSDGTVTAEFLLRLYRRRSCHYCRAKTRKRERTADHVIPLSRGGYHSAKNLVMACQACNIAKANQTKDEFMRFVHV